MDDRGSRHGKNSDDYYGGGNYQERRRCGDDKYERHRSDSYGGGDDPRNHAESDWRCAQVWHSLFPFVPFLYVKYYWC